MKSSTPIADLVMHPVRLKIMQQLAGRELTTAVLRAALPDVPPASLYRHIATLIEGGVVRVVEERRVRGATERTLAIGEVSAHADLSELQAMTDDQHRQAFTAFVARLAADFDRFLADPDADTRDFLGYGQAVLHVSQKDLEELQERLGALLTPYLSGDGTGKRRVILSTALVPD